MRVGAGPGDAAAGEGAVWTSNTVADTVSRIDPTTGNVVEIPLEFRPSGLAVGRGAVWVSNGESNKLARIAADAAKVVQTVRVGNAPAGVAAGGGSVWVANSADGTVSQVDPSSGKEVRRIEVGPNPLALAAGAGAVWVATSGSGAVVRIDPASPAEVSTVSVGNDPEAIAVGRGAVWVANTGDGTVSRIDPPANRVTDTFAVGARPTGIAVAGNTVWVALAGGSLERIDPADHAVRTTGLGAVPGALTVFRNALWTTALPAPRTHHRGGTLRVEVNWLHPCRCLDPAVAFDPSVEGPLLDLVYDGLVAFRRAAAPAGNSLVGDLAQTVPHATDGGRSYVFYLRRGTRFSNGELVRARDVRSSLERVLRLDHSDVFPGLDAILGASACTRARCDLSRGIETDDATGKVVFHLRTPEADFLYQLALPHGFVLPSSSPARPVRRPIPGTGPYEIAGYRPGRAGVDGWLISGTVTLVRNPRFRLDAPDARPAGFPDRIVVRVVPDPTRATTAVLRGLADVAPYYGAHLSAQELRSLAIRHTAQLRLDSGGATEYMALNTRVPPFDNVLARRAVNFGTDRGELARLLAGHVSLEPTCQLLPPGMPGYRPYCPYTLRPTASGAWSAPDVRRARALVAASGTRGMRVRVWTKEDHVAAGSYFAGLLRRLGYRASLRVVPGTKDYYGRIVDSGTVQIAWAGWVADYPSAGLFLASLVSCSDVPAPGALTAYTGNNFSYFCDRSLDRRIDAAARLQTIDPVQAGKAWGRIDHAVADAAPVVAFGNDLGQTIVSRRVGNYEFSPAAGPLLDQFWIR